MSRVLCLLFIFAFTGSAWAAGEEAFQQGLAAYQKRQFEEARTAFEKAAVDSPTARVLHNLALTYFQLNQKPHALGLWRKALAIDPGYGAARAGRDMLETRYNMHGYERDAFAATLARTFERVSWYEVLWAVAVLLALTGWLTIRYFGERRAALDEDRPSPAFPTTATLAGVLLLVAIATAVTKEIYRAEERATVVTDKTSVRSLPSDEGVSLYDIPGGSEVLVRQTRDGWLQVQDAAGQTGWVKGAEMLVTSKR